MAGGKRSKLFEEGGSLFSRVLNKNFHIVQAALMTVGEQTLLPEIYEIFGEDKTFKFLSVFGGSSIKVPSLVDCRQALRDVTIYVCLEKNNSTDMAVSLADEYELTPQTVRMIAKRMRDKLSALNLEVR